MGNAIVLGASGETGKVIVKLLLNLNYKVIGTYNSRRLEGTAKLTALHLDMASIISINKFLKKIENQKEVDVVINTISRKPTFGKIETNSIEKYKKDMEVNCLNFIYIIKNILGNLNRGANIISILTEAVVNPTPFISSYLTSKYALLGFMKSLDLELKEKEIYVNSISPGMMETEFISSFPSFIKSKYLSTHKSFIKPQQVGEVVQEILKNPMSGKNVEVFDKNDDRD
ncbi:MAG: SDR family oxidoreductase [Nanoarchaeota archaeon]|nr:SDR family oxidoreductase [Nanoarchaeota archaeon]